MSTSNERKTPWFLVTLVLLQSVFILASCAYIVTTVSYETPNYEAQLNLELRRLESGAGTVGIIAQHQNAEGILKVVTIQSLVVIDEALWHIKTLKPPYSDRTAHAALVESLTPCEQAVRIAQGAGENITFDMLKHIAVECSLNKIGDVQS